MTTRLFYAGVTSSLRYMLDVAFAGLLCRVIPFRKGRRLTRRQVTGVHGQQQHFASLDDQLLNDLGLQRSEIRAAELGILPADQALHGSGEDALSHRDNA